MSHSTLLGLSDNDRALNSALKSCLENKIKKTHCLQNDKVSSYLTGCDALKTFVFDHSILPGQIALHLCYLQYRKGLLFFENTSQGLLSEVIRETSQIPIKH